ncbi:MAG: hypothetical protein R3C68_06500 [Myxococcota bacterium]
MAAPTSKRPKQFSLTRCQRQRLQQVASGLKLDFIRIFGSCIAQKSTPRDIDVVVGGAPLSIADISLLAATLEEIFAKPIDLIQLRRGLSSTLIKEIAAHSRPLWESQHGRRSYADLIDRLWGVANDEELAFPDDLRLMSFQINQRKLSVP